MLERVLFNPIF